MPYEVYVHHPETVSRRAANFTSWMFWAEENAPWTGVGIDTMAAVLTRACAEVSDSVCQALDTGGELDASETRAVLRAAEDVMGDGLHGVFQRAVSDGYGVLVVFSQGSFGKAATASAYAEKQGSDPAH